MSLLFALLLARSPFQTPAKPKPYELSPGFWVSLPAKPKEEKNPEATSEKVWLSVTDYGVVFVVGKFHVDASKTHTSPDQALFNMTMGYLAGSHGTWTAMQDVVQNGWPGLEVRLKIPGEGAVGWLRNYIVGDTGYQVCALSTRPQGEMPGVREVFASVKLPQPEGPLKKAGPTFAPFAFPKVPVSVQLPGEPKIDEQPVKNNPYNLVIHRAVGAYAGRTYVSAYGEIPEEALAQLNEDAMPGFLEKANLDVAQSLKAKAPKTRTYKIGDRSFLTTEFTSGDGAMYGRVDSIVFDGRLHSFLALVPLPLKASAELSQFFASIKLGDK